MEYLYEKLEAYGKSDYYGFHMPGHKRNSDVTRANLPYGIDITEIEGFDNLHHAEEIIREAGIDHIRFTDLRHTCAILALKNGMDAKELAQMLGHYRPTITRQNYEPYLPRTAKKDEEMPDKATQSELQQAANILDNLLKF